MRFTLLRANEVAMVWIRIRSTRFRCSAVSRDAVRTLGRGNCHFARKDSICLGVTLALLSSASIWART